jgi:glycosyltransferase involved in cell wall biosynthesis
MGGAERLLHDIAMGSKARGHQILILNLFEEDYYSLLIERAGIPVFNIGLPKNWTKRPAQTGQLITSLFKIFRKVHQWNPDIIQTWMYPADLIGGLVGRMLSIPVIWGIFSGRTDPSIYKTKMHRLIRICARLSHFLPLRIISCSAFGRRSHIGIGYPAAKILFIPIGIPARSIYSQSAQTTATEDEGVIRIGMLSRFSLEKNHTTLILACAQLQKEGLAVRLLLAGGSGIEKNNQRLCTAIAENQLEKTTVLLGRIPVIDDFFDQIDIFCLLSLSEGFPTVVVEAMSAGLPCAVSDVGDAKGILSDSQQIIHDDSVSSTVTALKTLCLLGGAKRRALGKRNAMRAARCFPLEQMLDRYDRAYSAIVENPTTIGGCSE